MHVERSKSDLAIWRQFIRTDMAQLPEIQTWNGKPHTIRYIKQLGITLS